MVPGFGHPSTFSDAQPHGPEENIGNLGARIGVLAILICGVVFLIGLLINTKDPEYPDNPSSWVA